MRTERATTDDVYAIETERISVVAARVGADFNTVAQRGTIETLPYGVRVTASRNAVVDDVMRTSRRSSCVGGSATSNSRFPLSLAVARRSRPRELFDVEREQRRLFLHRVVAVTWNACYLLRNARTHRA